MGGTLGVFSRMFGSNQHLDIMFLSDDQERELERVCRPFFVVQGNTNPQDVASAAVTSGLKSVPLGAGLGAAGAGPVTEAVAGEISTVADAGYKYVAKELADSLAPEKEPE
jgi:hypothetical protein